MDDSHARGMAMQVNYLLDSGGFRVNADGTFSLDLKKTKKGVASLSHDLLSLQARGDYEGGKRMMEKLVILRPEVQTVLDRLGDVPVDIRPRFVTADDLEREGG
jgi:hypothetical protein